MRLKKVVSELREVLKLAAEYQGREVKLNKPTKGDRKKYKVYVKDPKTENVKKVEFGDPNLEIKRDDPERRKNFRSRHKCDTDPNAKDKTKPKYWSCRFWEGGKTVTELLNKKSSILSELEEIDRKIEKTGASDKKKELKKNLDLAFKTNLWDVYEDGGETWVQLGVQLESAFLIANLRFQRSNFKDAPFCKCQEFLLFIRLKRRLTHSTFSREDGFYGKQTIKDLTNSIPIERRLGYDDTCSNKPDMSYLVPILETEIKKLEKKYGERVKFWSIEQADKKLIL